MEQKKIKYGEVISLGFTEKIQKDEVYFNKFGYNWAIIQLKLTKNIYLDWEKSTQLCEMVRTKKHWVQNKMPIKDLDHLKEIVNFFKESKSEDELNDDDTLHYNFV